MNNDPQRYHRHRFPSEIISHAVWLYHRFGLSFRDVEDLLAERGITVSYEAIRLWCGKFGLDYARNFGGGKVDSATPGSLTRSSRPSGARDTTCGAPLTKMVMSSTSSSSDGEMLMLPGVSSGGYRRNNRLSRGG